MVTEVDRWKSSVIGSFFVSTADHNYIVARWAFFHHLYRDFYWNALQCLEKYMKAGLVLNGVSVKRFSHNISAMYKEFTRSAGDLLPGAMIAPSGINTWNWRAEPASRFVDSIYRRGYPDNRYAYFSYSSRPDDIFKLDGLAFCLRRLTVSLDGVDLSQETEGKYQTWRDWLRADQEYQPRGALLHVPTNVHGETRKNLEDTLHKMNFAFLRNKSDLRGAWPAWRAENSWLSLLVEGAEKKPVQTSQAKADTVLWLIDNVYFHRDIKRELREYAEVLRG